MAKFLFKASYTAEGAKGLMKEGGSGRRAAVEKAVRGAGGQLEAFYYAYGDADVYAICDFPNTTGALALSVAINATGAVKLSTVPLIAPEEIDAAVKRPATYRAPGAAARRGGSK